MTGSKDDELVYIITRMGCMHIIDSHTGITLYSQKLFDQNTLVFASCLSGHSGLICVTRITGEVYQINIRHDKIFEFAICRDDFLEFIPQVSKHSLPSM